MELLLIIVSIALIAAGFAGILLPAIPDLPLILLGLVLRSSQTGFESPSPVVLVVFLVITILVTLGEIAATPLGVKYFGGSQKGLWGALLGTLIGILAFPVSPWLIILGPFLGAVAGELSAGRSKKEAAKSGLGTLIGFVVTASIKLAISIGFVIAFVLSFF